MPSCRCRTRSGSAITLDGSDRGHCGRARGSATSAPGRCRARHHGISLCVVVRLLFEVDGVAPRVSSAPLGPCGGRRDVTATTHGSAPAVPQPPNPSPSATLTPSDQDMPAHVAEVISAAHAYAADADCTYDVLLARVDAAALAEAAPGGRTNSWVSQARTMGGTGAQPSEAPSPATPDHQRTSDEDPTWMNSTQRALRKIRNL